MITNTKWAISIYTAYDKRIIGKDQIKYRIIPRWEIVTLFIAHRSHTVIKDVMHTISGISTSFPVKTW